MSNETHQDSESPKPEAPTEPPAKSGSRRVVVIAVVAVAALAGVGGGLVAGPKVAAVRSGGAKPESHGEGEAEGGHGQMLEIENVVVNPAGSEGLRFLMASVAFEAVEVERLRQQEVRVRDLVMAVLERQPLLSLTQPGARDRIKRELAEAVAPLLGGGHVTVFLPQFVIQ